MPEVFFSTNPADWERLEGLYISERKSPGFIKGVNLSVPGIAGACVRGPTTPQEITSTARFLEVFGGRDIANDSSLALYGEVWRAMINKPLGDKLVVRRVVASDAVAAVTTLETLAGGGGTAVLTVTASSVGIWANGGRLKVKVSAPTDGVSGKFNLTARYLGADTLYENLNCTTNNDNLLAVVGEDIGNVVVLTKAGNGTPVTAGMAGIDADGFVSIGVTTSGFVVTAGSDGTVASADYIAGVDALAAYKGVGVVALSEASTDQAALNGELVVLAAEVADRIFVTWSGIHGQAVATEVTSKTTEITTESDRIVWCFNSAKIADPATALKIDSAPHHWMLSIFTQNDVDVHPGEIATRKQLASILEVRNASLSRGDLISLKDAGICALEKLDDGFAFHSGVCTDASEITTRRSRDFLQLSAAARLKSYVKTRSTVTRRKLMVGELDAFCASLKDDERIIEAYEIKDNVTSDAEAGRGLRKILWRVRLIGHLLYLVLETDIDTGVTIEKAA